jgi:protein-tyrosine phosphatase/membrane-associated phospholipid phosphatase
MTNAVKPFAALKTSLFLCGLFLVVYATTNWAAAQHAHVDTIFFEWERQIPFVPLMIIPYMSIDLFFVSAPFVCRDKRELEVLARRITFAILFAGLCFLLFPLRFAFDRPPVEGWLGPLFRAFRTFDRPYNLMPSLHIAFQIILTFLYARHTKGLLRLVTNIWFILIGLSTLLTYQHHVLDVLGGGVLAGYCFYLFPDSPPRAAMATNLRVAFYYGAGAALALSLAPIFWPWGILFLWPAASLAIVAAGYLGLGSAIFRKTDGRLPLSARFVLAPCLVGQWLSWIYYRRQCRPWDKIGGGVLIGRRLTEREAARAAASGVMAVLDLTAEFSEARPFRQIKYLNIPILDLTAPTQQQLQEMVDFIEKHFKSGKVYVHCKVGYSRSAAAVGAWLLATGQVSNVAEVLSRLRQARPAIIIRPEIVEALNVFALRRHEFIAPTVCAVA